MISILIPVYDYDCSVLVSDLHAQGEALHAATGDNFEIILGDDCSNDTHTLRRNREACRLSHCRLLESPCNLGRAKNRNRLAAAAAGDTLLFVDCDAEVGRNDFLIKYNEAAKHHKVVCGGIDTPAQLPSREVLLRYEYERKAKKIRTLAFRRANPYKYFSTFNFMIHRKVFMNIMFNENCIEYGYEDALFGMQLEQRGIAVEHIDNPLVHTGMDTNECFIDKCEQAMRTLKTLDRDMKSFSNVGNIALKFKSLHLLPLVKAWHTLLASTERANLCGKHPSLLVLKLYKLGYFCSIGGAE